jgi:hypothetical protein
MLLPHQTIANKGMVFLFDIWDDHIYTTQEISSIAVKVMLFTTIQTMWRELVQRWMNCFHKYLSVWFGIAQLRVLRTSVNFQIQKSEPCTKDFPILAVLTGYVLYTLSNSKVLLMYCFSLVCTGFVDTTESKCMVAFDSPQSVQLVGDRAAAE